MKRTPWVLACGLLAAAASIVAAQGVTMVLVHATPGNPGPLVQSATTPTGKFIVASAHLTSATGHVIAQVIATPGDPGAILATGSGTGSVSAGAPGVTPPPQNASWQGFGGSFIAQSRVAWSPTGTAVSGKNGYFATSNDATVASGAATAVRCTPGSAAGASATNNGAITSAHGNSSGSFGCLTSTSVLRWRLGWPEGCCWSAGNVGAGLP